MDMDRESQLKNYIETTASLIKKSNMYPDFRYSSFYELVLEKGRFMEPKKLPKSIKLGLPKSCYYNCQQLIKQKRYSNLSYCEGYALPSTTPLPVPHAWLVNQNGYVLDLTWDNPGAAYLGITFFNDWVLNFISARNKDVYSLFECNYLEDFSFLREGLPSISYRK